MSWDATLVTACCGTNRGDWNYTYNTTPMTVAAAATVGVEWGGFQHTLDGMEALEAASVLAAICDEMVRNSSRYEDMNPENGWGDRVGIVKVMREMVDASLAAPEGSVWRVS